MIKLSFWVKIFLANLLIVLIIVLGSWLNLIPYIIGQYEGILFFLLFVTGGLVFIKDPYSVLEWNKLLFKIQYSAEVKFTESNVKWTKISGYIILAFGLFLLIGGYLLGLIIQFFK